MEMSTKTADKQFHLQKKIEAHFTEKYPGKWLPLYDRVTFSLNPYVDALAIGDLQKSIMDEVMLQPDIEEKWDSEEIEQLILSKLL